jgi:hypothetical protein
MKYENYGKVLDIAAKITKLKNLLDDISVDDTVVEIKGYFSRNPGIKHQEQDCRIKGRTG